MSEKMYPIPFRSLMNWIVTEYAREGDIFGVHKAYRASGKTLPIFGERIETPFGPAAGPNSQLAQNIIAAYFAGARFFEVKTVQKMDGEELARCVPRPCILADDEGYNQEWSTELEVPQAMNEYIKAWCALKLLSKRYDLGDPDGFVFNMSVGYGLEGIHFSARLALRHRLHAARLPAAGDRAHRVVSADGKGPSHLRQVQSDHPRLQDRAHDP